MIRFFHEHLMTNTPNLYLLKKTLKVPTVWARESVEVAATFFQLHDTFVADFLYLGPNPTTTSFLSARSNRRRRCKSCPPPPFRRLYFYCHARASHPETTLFVRLPNSFVAASLPRQPSAHGSRRRRWLDSSNYCHHRFRPTDLPFPSAPH